MSATQWEIEHRRVVTPVPPGNHGVLAIALVAPDDRYGFYKVFTVYADGDYRGTAHPGIAAACRERDDRVSLYVSIEKLNKMYPELYQG